MNVPVGSIIKVPTVGGVTGVGLIVNGSPSGSLSLDNKSAVNTSEFSMVKLSSVPAGPLFVKFVLSSTSILTIAVSHKTGLPGSHISYSKLAVPVNPVVGVNV